MGIDLDDKLVETASKVVTTANEYGDRTMGAVTTVACLYRDISSRQLTPNMIEANIQGYLWFGADNNIKRGDVFHHSVEGYLKIERITRAKTLLTTNTRQFIKCEVSKFRQVS